MTLRQHQSAFTEDVCRLIKEAWALGLEVTFGEVYRTAEQQKIYLEQGKSKTLNSYHCKRLAIDLNFFIKGELLDFYDKTEQQRFERNAIYTKLSKYWASLNPLNVAGYTWGWDDNHFERAAKGV